MKFNLKSVAGAIINDTYYLYIMFNYLEINIQLLGEINNLFI